MGINDDLQTTILQSFPQYLKTRLQGNASVQPQEHWEVRRTCWSHSLFSNASQKCWMWLKSGLCVSLIAPQQTWEKQKDRDAVTLFISARRERHEGLKKTNY